MIMLIKDKNGKDVPTLNAACNAGQGYIDLKISLDKNKKIAGFSNPKVLIGMRFLLKIHTPVDPDCKQIVDDAVAALANNFY